MFNIRTNATLLKEYLQDMKVVLVKLYDNRNNEQLGNGVLNWNLYINKISNKNSPFLEDIFESPVQIFNYKKKLMADVQITIKWEILKLQQ
jgi:hypothetical protein